MLDAFAARDLDRARAVWQRDQEVDEHYDAIFRELLTYMMGDPRTIASCAHLLFVAKNLERIGDHATNIAEIITYEITGEQITDARPKLDPLERCDAVSAATATCPSIRASAGCQRDRPALHPGGRGRGRRWPRCCSTTSTRKATASTCAPTARRR